MKVMSMFKILTPAVLATLAGLILITPAAQAAGVDLAVGDVFAYQGTAPPAPESAEGQPVTIMMPRPVEQTVRVLEEVPCGDTTCLKLEAEQKLPSYGLGSSENGNTARRWAKVEKETGKLVELEVLMQVAGQQLRRTTPVKSANSIFANFYGTWMQDLAEGWSASFDLSGDRQRRYEVTGQETVAGRPCFVVVRTTPQQGGDIQKTTFWVDRDRRISVQVQEGDWELVLQPAETSD